MEYGEDEQDGGEEHFQWTLVSRHGVLRGGEKAKEKELVETLRWRAGVKKVRSKDRYKG